MKCSVTDCDWNTDDVSIDCYCTDKYDCWECKTLSDAHLAGHNAQLAIMMGECRAPWSHVNKEFQKKIEKRSS